MKRFEHGGNIHRFRASQGAGGQIKRIIDFSANINCLGPSECVRTAFEASFRNMDAYPDPHYTRFIEAVSEKWHLNRNHVYAGNGAAELLHMAVAAIMPKKALVVGPTFVEYERALEAYGCETQFFMTSDHDLFRPDLNSFFKTIENQRPDLVILCNPNNPTGVLMERAELEPLLALCGQQGVHLLLDEAFMDFAAERASMMNAAAQHENLLILRSLTKFHAIPAIRAGFVVTASPVFAKHYEAKSIPWSMNQAAQEVAVAAIEDMTFETATLQYYQSESGRFAKDLAQLPNFKVFQPEANYVFFRFDGQLALEESLKEQGILIRSCRNYRGLDARYFRVAVKSREDNDTLVSLLREILNNDDH